MPLIKATAADHRYMGLALAEAQRSFDEGGEPVGSVMIHRGRVVGRGHNRSIQNQDPASHAEIECVRNGGLRRSYAGVTLYTTVSPCMMCTGALLFLKIPKVVIGDRRTYAGDIPFLVRRGVSVVVLDDDRCTKIMQAFIDANPRFWREIGSGGGARRRTK